MITKLNFSKTCQIQRTGLILAAVLFVAGCASTPPPTGPIATARAAVSAANSAGGNEFAPTEIKSAMVKLDAAEHAMVKKDYLHALWLAEESEVDAQLAEAKARSAKAQKVAETLREDSRVLRQEINRNAQ